MPLRVLLAGYKTVSCSSWLPRQSSREGEWLPLHRHPGLSVASLPARLRASSQLLAVAGMRCHCNWKVFCIRKWKGEEAVLKANLISAVLPQTGGLSGPAVFLSQDISVLKVTAGFLLSALGFGCQAAERAPSYWLPVTWQFLRNYG